MKFESNGRLHRKSKLFVMMYSMDMTNYWKSLNENQNDSEDSQEQPVGEPEEIEEEDLVIDEIDTEFEEVDPGKDDPDLDDEEEVIANDTVQESSEIQEVDEMEVEVVGNAPLGRPSKLDETTQKKLNTALQVGLSQKKAPIYAGIGETTFYRWQKRAIEIDEECQGNPDNIKDVADLELWEFWESIKKAKVDGEINHLGNITSAANNGVWQASAWFLERSNPNDWSKREKDDENAGKKEPIVVKIKFD